MIDLSHIFSEKTTTKDINSRVLIIDGLNSFIRIWSSIPLISDTGEHVGGTVGFLRSIGKNIREFNPTRCIIVIDGKGGSTRRKKLYPEYKDNRTGKFNLRRDVFSTEDDERASRQKQMMRVVQYLELLPIQLFCIDNIEADDAIAYITSNFYEKEANKIRIVSTDRDFLQLVSDKVEVYSPVKKKLYDSNAIKTEFGIHPNNYLLYRVLTGDDSDNINGIKGLGLKTLIKSFPEIVEKELTIDYLYSQSKSKVKDKKIYATIAEGKQIIDRNYQLMQLHDTDISTTVKLQMVDALRGSVTKMDRATFKKYIREDGLQTTFANLENWLNTTFNSLAIWSTN